MTFVVETFNLQNETATDSYTSSRDTARRRRDELERRGFLAQVVKGTRIVVDFNGTEAW